MDECQLHRYVKFHCVRKHVYHWISCVRYVHKSFYNSHAVSWSHKVCNMCENSYRYLKEEKEKPHNFLDTMTGHFAADSVKCTFADHGENSYHFK